MHAELIEDDGESRYKVTDIIGKPGVTKYCSFIKIIRKRNELNLLHAMIMRF